MKKPIILIFLISGLVMGAMDFSGPPEAEISNGLIHARLYLPDPENGYYRGSRFDWSGVIASLEYSGHQYFGQWFKEYSPTLHDAIPGPVESFDPIGYDEAKTGGSFLKIGIGVLSRTDESPYAFAKTYPIVNGGKWNAIAGPGQVQFIHTFSDPTYSYRYEKTVRLISHKPEMVIAHTLKNTGKQTLETAVYNHNFFMLDNQTTGPGFEIAFPFALPAEAPAGSNEFVKFDGHKMTFLKALDPKDHVFFRDMTNGKEAPYDLRIENHNTGAAVRITADRTISKILFWSASTTVCPEPFIKIRVDPGKEFSWKITYEYYACEVR